MPSKRQSRKSSILDRGTIKSLDRTFLLFIFVIYDRHLGMNSIERLPNNVFSSLKNLQGLYVYINYNTRHKSLKQEPFVLNFL